MAKASRRNDSGAVARAPSEAPSPAPSRAPSRAPLRGRGATPALRILVASGVAHTVHAYELPAGLAVGEHAPDGDSYGERVASFLGVDHRRLFKTLVTEVDGALTVAVVPVSATLDLRALAAHRGAKRATMATPAAAERATGYVTGGISPLGQRTALPTVVDGSADDWETVFVSAGKRGLQVELSPTDLLSLCFAEKADIRAHRTVA